MPNIIHIRSDMYRVEFNGKESADYGFSAASVKLDRACIRLLEMLRQKKLISKITENAQVHILPKQNGVLPVIAAPSGRLPSPSRNDVMEIFLSFKETLYRFSTLPSLCTAAKILSSRGLCQEGSVYSDGTCYFLSIEEKINRRKNISAYSFLSEYGWEIPAEMLGYIKERYLCLGYQDAVSVYSVLFDEEEKGENGKRQKRSLRKKPAQGTYREE